jgi:DNA repair exonuclease SbcCD ATPase subunit
LAAREAEINCNEAARRREWREAARAPHVYHSVGIRLAEPPPSTRVQAEQVSEPEINQSEAVAPGRRAEDDFIQARLAELDDRERTLADREKLIATLETLLDRSRQRLEEQLEQLAQRNAALKPTPRLEAARPPSSAIEFVSPYPIRGRLVEDPVRQRPTAARNLTASTG